MRDSSAMRDPNLRRSTDRVVTVVDATAVPEDRGGVGRYVDGILANLDGRVVIVCQARDAAYFAHSAPLCRVIPQSRLIERTISRFIWEQVRLPQIARQVGAAVIHSPHYTVPLVTRAARVVTFHDATFFSDKALHTRVKRLFFSAWIRLALHLATDVIVPSNATALEIAKYTGARPQSFTVAYHGVDESVFHPPTKDEVSSFRSQWELGEQPWMAFLGTIEPRKNLPSLVQAYSIALSRLSKSEEAPELLVAGGAGWETGLEKELALVPGQGRVRMLGFIPLDQVRVLLGGATLMVYPSLGEGFGLPVLEGMACGAAVLTTRRLALPEVGGDAVAYTDVDAESIASALVGLLKDDEQRKRLRADGLRRSLDFTWARSAAVHQKVYDRAGSR